jgi:hypothetical protein
MEDGSFHLFSVDPATGIRQMIYTFRFIAGDGKKYFLHGVKWLKDDPGFDMVEDLTTLFATIYAGEDDMPPLCRGRSTSISRICPSSFFMGFISGGNFGVASELEATVFSQFRLDEIKDLFQASVIYKK